MAARTIIMLAAVAAVLLLMGEHSATAAPSRGVVRCDDGQDLQSAIDDPRSGSTLRIYGECVGTFIVDRDIRLRGVDGATLRGPFEGTVLTIGADAEVTVADLTITGGRPNIDLPTERRAGGIYNAGDLTLAGSTTVEGNTDYSCGPNPPPKSPCDPTFPFWDNIERTGGIINTGTLLMRAESRINSNHRGVTNYGVMVMKGRASVANNRAGTQAGIVNRGHLTVEDRASIHDNNAASTIAGTGGGISNTGTVVLRGRAFVSANHSGQFGGGIVNDGRLVLQDRASVFSNEARTIGHDIYNTRTGTVELGRRTWVGTLVNQMGGTILGYIDRVESCNGC